MFRLGSRAALPATWVLWLIGSSVAMILMSVSLWAEYRALPGDAANAVRKSYYESFSPRRLAELQSYVRGRVEAYLAAEYPPGGFVGYLRWAAASGTLTLPRFQKTGSVTHRARHSQGKWLIRVALSALLVEWAIMSQVLALRDPKARSIDRSIYDT